MKRVKSPNCLEIFIWIFLLFGFVSVFSFSTSFLYKPYGVDSYIFMGIGQGLLDGKLPYRELAENKGPVFFLVQMIGQMMCRGRLGTFFLQVIFLTIDFWLIKRIYKFLDLTCYYIGIALFTIYLILTYAPGNTVEEYILTFILAQAVLFLKIYTDDHVDYRAAVLMGIITMSVLYIRMNDAFAILFMDLAACCVIWKREKERKKAIRFAAAGLGGILAVYLAVYVWLNCLGIWQDMIDGYIFINNKYTASGTVRNMINIRIWMLLFSDNAHIGEIMLGAIFVLRYLGHKKKKNKLKVLPLVGGLLCLFFQVFVSVTGYRHYIIVFAPMAVVFAILLEELLQEYARAKQILVLSVVPFAIYACLCGNMRQVFSGYAARQAEEKYNSMLEVSEEIGEGSVYGYGVEPSFWYVLNRYPAYKEYLLISFLNIDSEKVGKNFSDYILNCAPDYFVFSVEAPDLFELLPPQSGEYFAENYDQIYQNGWGILYQYTGERITDGNGK